MTDARGWSDMRRGCELRKVGSPQKEEKAGKPMLPDSPHKDPVPADSSVLYSWPPEWEQFKSVLFDASRRVVLCAGGRSRLAQAQMLFGRGWHGAAGPLARARLTEGSRAGLSNAAAQPGRPRGTRLTEDSGPPLEQWLLTLARLDFSLASASTSHRTGTPHPSLCTPCSQDWFFPVSIKGYCSQLCLRLYGNIPSKYCASTPIFYQQPFRTSARDCGLGLHAGRRYLPSVHSSVIDKATRKQPLGIRKPELCPRPALDFLCDLGQVPSPRICIPQLYFLTCKVNQIMVNIPFCSRILCFYVLLARNETVLPTSLVFHRCPLCTASSDFRAI